jgi:HK97 family phage prohead protease
MIIDRQITALEVASDRRSVEALLVPWMTPTDVADVIDGRVVGYREQFARGSFTRAEKAPHRVMLCWGHSDDFQNALGRGESFRDTDSGEVGVFRLNVHDADRAAALLGDGMGVSARFESLRPRVGVLERPGALVTREQVHLVHVAAVSNPAYEDARVLAVRQAAEEQVEKARAEREFWDVLDRSVRLGVTLNEELRGWYDTRKPVSVTT